MMCSRHMSMVQQWVKQGTDCIGCSQENDVAQLLKAGRSEYLLEGFFRGFWSGLILGLVIAFLPVRCSHADVKGELRMQLEQQAKAAAMAEGPAPGIKCMQIRRRGATAICITLDEWRRQHADDQTARAEPRVGMRM